MGTVHSFAKKLARFPRLKRMAKNTYFSVGNLLSDKKTDLPGLVQISSDKEEHNFGYYDKCPWSRDQRYMIYVASPDAWKNYVSEKAVPIVLFDCTTGKEIILTKTQVKIFESQA